MGRYIVVIIFGIAIVLVIIFLNKALVRNPEESESYMRTQKVATGEIITPETVRVTLGDSLYHKPECDWIGRGSKLMSLENAIKRGFYPCPYCIEEE